MRRSGRRPSPALILAALALTAALGAGGAAVAASKIDGRTIRAKSIPGNRLKPGSVPVDRLRPGSLAGLGGGGPVTGAQVDERSLGQVPSADYADSAGVAIFAGEAETARSAIDAVDAERVNGHTAGCMPGTQLFAGACWQSSPSQSAATAPVAATACATQGGTLPEALQLAAFSQAPGVSLTGEEWSSDIANISGQDLYGVATVLPTGELNFALSTSNKKYRCVIPIVI